MNKSELERFKKILLGQKEELLGKTSVFKETRRNEKPDTGDEADIATGEMSMNLDIRLHERERFLVHKIELALARIEGGTYGDCQECGDQMNTKRLEARPVATLCIACKEEQEATESRYHIQRAN